MELNALRKHFYDLENQIYLQKLLLYHVPTNQVQIILKRIWTLSVQRETALRLLESENGKPIGQPQVDEITVVFNGEMPPQNSSSSATAQMKNISLEETTFRNPMDELDFLNCLNHCYFSKGAIEWGIVSVCLDSRLQYLKELDKINSIFQQRK
jgi:hypothetical protein